MKGGNNIYMAKVTVTTLGAVEGQHNGSFLCLIFDHWNPTKLCLVLIFVANQCMSIKQRISILLIHAYEYRSQSNVNQLGKTPTDLLYVEFFSLSIDCQTF